MPSLLSATKLSQSHQFRSALRRQPADSVVTKYRARPAVISRDAEPPHPGTLVMLRHTLVFAALLSVAMLPSGGCRSCSDCHDYDPPVLGCSSGCGQRAGSNCASDCAPAGACGCDGCESGGHYETAPGTMQEQEYVEPSAEEVGT
jgi:hypothetical protein